MIRKPMTISKDGMRTLVRYPFLPSETKIKSTFQWKGDSFVIFAMYISIVLLHIIFAKPCIYLTVGTILTLRCTYMDEKKRPTLDEIDISMERRNFIAMLRIVVDVCLIHNMCSFAHSL